MQELVIMKKGEAVCSSLQVAEVFEKRHDNILRDIKGLLNFEETHGMFQKSTRVDKQNGQTYPMYYMNRDGFSLLVIKRQMHYKDIYKDCKAKMETLSSISYLAI